MVTRIGEGRVLADQQRHCTFHIYVASRGLSAIAEFLVGQCGQSRFTAGPLVEMRNASFQPTSKTIN